MADRVVLFIDYQNSYQAARRTFPSRERLTNTWGQFNPRLLGEYLVDASPYDRELIEVRCYRGMPSPHRDARAHAAWRAQTTAWANDGVATVSRPLWYPQGWPASAAGEKPREKGIDVALATEILTMTFRQEFDVAVVMTLDTDLKPALEAVREMARKTGRPRLEVAAWSSSGNRSPRLALSGQTPWCHWLDRAVYEKVRDIVDYGA